MEPDHLATTTVKESLLLSLLHLRKAQTFRLEEKTLQIGDKTYPLVEIMGGTVTCPWHLPAWFKIRKLHIEISSNLSQINRSILAFQKEADELEANLKRRVSSRLVQNLTKIEEYAEYLRAKHDEVYRPDRYVRFSVAMQFSDGEEKRYRNALYRVRSMYNHPFLGSIDQERASTVSAKLEAFADSIQSPESARNTHNQAYIDHWKAAENDYFQKVESSSLTDEQIQTALVFEDATLVVAAAGSGKSSCIVGKIGFALKTGLFEDSQILALAYNSKAAKGLQERLNKKLEKALGRTVAVASKTFHGFGLHTLIQHYGKGYEPKVLKEEGNEEGRFIKAAISKLVETDTSFQTALTQWMSLSPYEEPEPVGISGDLNECAKRYEECCLERLRARRDPQKKPWEPTIPTWKQDIYVRSLEERSIANWLALHDIAFKYEQPDWNGAKRLGLGNFDSGKPKPYNPDFTYTYSEKLPGGKPRTVRVVHEHFALNEAGHAPEWIGGKVYEEHASNKRSMYRFWIAENNWKDERVVFFESTSAMMRDGSIWKHLETNLTMAGLTVGSPSAEIQSKALEQFRESSDLEQLVVDFVLRFKDSGLSESDVRQEAAQSDNPNRSQLFLEVAFAVYHAYQNALQAAGKIDFADMIRDAITVLSKDTTTCPYRFVLVDEFQDIAKLKADLVKAVLAKNPVESIVFCVGDDWQTINRFSGSDVSIFTNAGEYFGRFTSRLELTRTFRCSQGIADVARHLVMLNPIQFDKAVKAIPDRIQGSVRIVNHADSAEARQSALRSELGHIVTIAGQLGIAQPSVQILRRTKHDATVAEGVQTEFLNNIAREFKDRLSIEILTMHGSKGLEADFVILPGLDSGFRGFPDERPAEPLLDLVLPTLANPVEEERRLMYVALTRAKILVSVLVASKRPSEFAIELESAKHRFPAIQWIPYPQEQRIPCPKCKLGSLVEARGNSGKLICSRKVSCGYTTG